MERGDGVSNGVHARERFAVRDDHEASSMHESLGGNLYKLLIKNVSKNQPLTAEEAQELKAFRATLTTEQWQRWLNFAREEKQKMKLKKATSPKSLILTSDPELLLHAIMKTEKTASSNDAGIARHMEIPSDMVHPMTKNPPRDVPQPITEHFPVVEDLWNQNTAVNDPPQTHQLKEIQIDGPPLQKSSKKLHPVPTPAVLPPQTICETQGQEVRREPSKWELREQSEEDVVDKRVVPSPRASPSNLSEAYTDYREHEKRLHSYSDHPVSDNRDNVYDKSSSSGGVSLELGIIRRNSRGRASSAPRERHAGAASTTTPMHHVSFGSRSSHAQVPLYSANGYHHMTIPADRDHHHTHSPKLKHSHQEDFFGGGGGPRPSPSLSPPAVHHHHQQQHQRQYQYQHTQNGSRGAYIAHGSHVASRARGPHSPEISYYSHQDSRARTPGPYSSRSNYPKHPQHAEASVLDLADAAEIARSTAFRLDSAYSAAQCLLSSISADHAQNYLFTGGRNCVQTPVAPGNAVDPEKAHATMSILSEMISSMEKSKESLAQLSSLHQHLQQVPPQPPASAQRAGHPRSHSAPRSRSRREDLPRPEESYDRWASPTSSMAQPRRKKRQDEHDQVDQEEEEGRDSVHSRSPEDREIGAHGEGEDFYSSSPFLELGRSRAESANQLLSFDDLAPHGGFLEKQNYREDVSSAANNLSTLRSSRKEAKWFPDSSGALGAGASLNAHYAQEKPPSDFSPWNKQLAASSTQEPLDPVSNLQTQLYGAAQTQRKVANNLHTISAAPVPRAELQNQQFSYNRAGYVWEGVRYNRAQGPVVRLCLAQGPLIKAYDDYPIRVDAESGVVDVVWREARHGDATASEALLASSTRSNPSPIAKLLASETKQTYFTDSSANIKRNTVLRRERFAFDDVFVGQTALGRLAFFTRQRARKALETAHNLNFLCLGCGDVLPATGTSVEPPIGVLLGGGGGTGLISSVVDEIFRFTKPLTTSLQEKKGLHPGSFPTASPSAFVASKLAFEQVKTRVTLSAIILTEKGDVFDLLGGSADGAASLKRRKSDGRVMLCNASRLQLQASADFDRVMGLLLGKRTALHGVLQSLQVQHAQQLKQGIVPAQPLQQVLASIDPWASFNAMATSHEGAMASPGASSAAASMLITVSVSGGSVTSNHTSVDFNFVSPCGRNWNCPGADINILAELVSSLPHTPPPSLLRASALGMLLMDPRNPASDFINVVTVHREEGEYEESKLGAAAARAATRESCSSVVQGALHSLRIIAQLTQ